MRLAELYSDGIDVESRLAIVEYIESRTERTETGCWIWKGRINHGGYGMAAHRRITFRAHRLAFEAIKGEIPSSLVLDHLCRNRACCNPDHLELVTNRENLMRGEGVAAKGSRKTHCAQGHSFEKYGAFRPNGWRWCRECHRIWNLKRTKEFRSSIPLQ